MTRLLDLPRPALKLAQRWRRRWGGEHIPPRPDPDLPVDPLKRTGQLLQEARERQNLTLRQLALDTRISTAVIEALEKGWRERLPEPTYLRTILALLERRLGLTAGVLDGALPPVVPQAAPKRRQGWFRGNSPGTIAVLTTWQGVVLYGVLTLALLYGLNLQQQRLARQGLTSLRPIPAAPALPSQERPDPAMPLLERHPELRPLRRASAGAGRRLRDRSREPAPIRPDQPPPARPLP